MRIEEEVIDPVRFANLDQEGKKKRSARSMEQAVLSSLVAQSEETKALGKNVHGFKKEWKVEEVTEGKNT